MAEYAVRVWRRRRPLVGNPARIVGLEHDGISLEAPSPKSALEQVIDAEYKEGDSRIRVYVQVEHSEGGHLGMGDYALCELALKEDEKCRGESGALHTSGKGREA